MRPRRPDYHPGQILYLVPTLKTCPSAAYRHTKVKFVCWAGAGRACVRVVSRYAAARVTITTHFANLTRRKPLPATAARPPRTRRTRDQPPPPGHLAATLAPAEWWQDTA